jgi:hypothetical protein
MVDMIRHLLALVAIAGIALALGACGGGKDDNNPKDRQDKAFDGALKFAKCMREHGIPMSDPTKQAGGGILQKIGGPGQRDNDLGPDSPKMKAADKACAKYRALGGGQAPDPAKVAQQRDAFVAYARCMRGKGIAMPDPKVSGNGIQMTLGKGIRPDSPVFKKADQACHSLLGATPDGARGKGGPVGGATSFGSGPKP